ASSRSRRTCATATRGRIAGSCVSTASLGHGHRASRGCQNMIRNEIDFEGLIKKIRDLPVRAGRNAGRRALRKGANVTRDAARINARAIDDPETREQIFKNISVSGGGSRRERRMGG